MGVKGLWPLLEPVGRRISIEALQNKRLAVGEQAQCARSLRLQSHCYAEAPAPPDKVAPWLPTPVRHCRRRRRLVLLACLPLCRCLDLALPIHPGHAG
jgi:hypothetical protein